MMDKVRIHPIMPGRYRAAQARQRGMSLIFALITLVSMMLAAIALVRSVDSGSQILGNIGFQQDATASADRATREATTYLTSGADLTTNSAAGSPSASNTGFYAFAPANLDVTGQLGSPSTHTLVDWDGNSCNSGSGAACLFPHAAVGTPNNTASYVILRLCQSTGAIGSSNCAQPLTATGGGPSNNGACMAGGGKCASAGTPTGQYFRIIVRVSGSRSTTSFTETIVQY
jgi:type IV pilus assembly protein PilX